MKSRLPTVALLCSMTLIAASILHVALAGESNPASSDDAGAAVPKPAAYAHYLRLRVLEVVRLERIESTQILKLRVERAYGKIDTQSLERAKAHETPRFTILFPATPDAQVETGDLIDYQLVDFTSMCKP